MDCGLRGKVAMISGGGSGIGLAIARLLAEEGADISICSRSIETLSLVASQIEADHGVRCLPVAGNLTNQESIERWVRQTHEAFGKIDILMNNANATHGGKFLDLAASDINDGLALKLFGYLNVTRSVLPIMRKQGGGAIVNIVGVAGLQPVAGSVVGSLAGASLINFTNALSNEVIGLGIRVNAVNPGITSTHRRTLAIDALKESGMDEVEAKRRNLEGVPIGRAARPEEIASVAVFVASERASYMVGETVNVDGGLLKGI